MTSPSTDGRRIPWATIAALGAFVADLLTPLGVATGVLYVGAVIVALAVRRTPLRALHMAAVVSALVIVGAFVKHGAVAPTWVVIVNRALSVGVIWTTAILVALVRRRQEAAERADAARKRSKLLLEAAMEHTPDGILLVEPGGRIQAANRAAHEMFGWDEGKLIGEDLEVIVPEASRSAHREGRADYLKKHPAVRRMAHGKEVSAARKDGTRVAIEVGVAPAGIEDLVIASVRDVTERVRFEERRRAAQRMEAIGQLAGGVAHDFNNLLGVIIICGEFLREKLPDSQDVDDILAAARRGAELTKQLLAFSRRQIVAPRRLDLNQLVEETRRMLVRILGEDIELQTHAGADLWAVEIDLAALEQILLNLVVNARDAMPKGGKLTIETKNVTLDEEYAAEHPGVTPGDYVMMGVSDTGVGMTDDVRVRVFEPFFSTKPVGSGTGLGLATVYGIVKQAEGHIWVYSEPGGGTTFRVYLPRADGAAESLRPIRESMRPRGGTERLLVVEDEPTVRRTTVRALRAAGYDVLEASNGLDAIKKVESIQGDLRLVVTDVVMPQMGGRELADKVAKLRPGIRILFVSGYTENAIVHHGVLDPGLVFLQKPFTPEQLLRRVRELLDAPC